MRWAGRLPDVTLAESNLMPCIRQPKGGAIHIGRHKRHFCVGAFPGERGAAAYEVLHRVQCPEASVRAKRCVHRELLS